MKTGPFVPSLAFMMAMEATDVLTSSEIISINSSLRSLLSLGIQKKQYAMVAKKQSKGSKS
jgi:hypothetical protein